MGVISFAFIKACSRPSMLSRHNVKRILSACLKKHLTFGQWKRMWYVSQIAYSSRDQVGYSCASKFLSFHIFFHILHTLVINPSYNSHFGPFKGIGYTMVLPLRSVRLWTGLLRWTAHISLFEFRKSFSFVCVCCILFVRVKLWFIGGTVSYSRSLSSFYAKVARFFINCFETTSFKSN